MNTDNEAFNFKETFKFNAAFIAVFKINIAFNAAFKLRDGSILKVVLKSNADSNFIEACNFKEAMSSVSAPCFKIGTMVTLLNCPVILLSALLIFSS
ncbi:hypothetical protein [Cohnella abietis]|uniref:hypothetical protein n=1 Tax=Cohnella abietis TaxID=2507935 RepID=UPI00102EACBE|nr:hypothetical protein [Cohnella abietis]